MKERPILFSAPMVRALLDGSKTQTRRIAKAKDLARASADGVELWSGFMGWQLAEAVLADQSLSTNKDTRCPHGQLGDRLWVRETHRPIFGQTCGLIAVDYLADPREKWERLGDQIGTPTKWTPSIHMRREYSRIMLEVVSVRVERLNDCSEADAQAEGATLYAPANHLSHGGWSHDGYYVHASARESYERLWNAINGAGSWEANPWVWVVEFKRVTTTGEITP